MKSETFPLTIKSGSVTVKIYRTANRDGDLFTVAYRGPSGRVRKNFSGADALAKAKAEAKAKAQALSAGDHAALRLTGEDRAMHVAAVEALRPTGVALDVAARDFAAAWAHLGGASIVEAARYYSAKVLTGFPVKTVKECADSYLLSLEHEGLSKAYITSRRSFLNRFARAFSCNVRDLTPDAVTTYANGLKLGKLSRNHHIKAIRGVLNHAKAQGWMPQNEITPADTVRLAKIRIENVEIFTPEEMAAILAAADEEFRPVLVLIAFCGVRREEAGRMDWNMINFERGMMFLPGSITKTGRPRKVEPLQPAAVALLAPYKDAKSPVFAKDMDRRFEKMIAAVRAKLPEFTWKANGLRHSFCSYRLEQCRNAGQVALEAGNSAATIMKHYQEVVSAEAAEAYWKLGLPADAPEAPEHPDGSKADGQEREGAEPRE